MGFLKASYTAAAGGYKVGEMCSYPNIKSGTDKKVFDLFRIQCSKFTGFAVRGFLDLVFEVGRIIHSNTVAEKNAALAFLKSAEVLIIKTTWKKMAETAAQKQLSKEAGIIAIKNLAKQLGVNLTKRKALAAIPVIGAAVGGSVNGWYMKEVGWAARHKYQERWLKENHKIIEI